MADNENLILKIQTFKNALTKRTDDSIGKIMINAAVGIPELAKDIVPVVGNVQYETIVSIANRLVDAAVKRLKMGCTVNFGVCHARPSVYGPFYGENPKFDPELNSIGVSVSPTQVVREAMKDAPVKMAGQAQTGPVINYVIDVRSGEQSSVLTPGRNLKIFGQRLTIAGESAKNGVAFVSVNGESPVVVEPEDLVDNMPSQLTVVIPQLEPGEYYVEVTTQFSTSKTVVKEPRTYRFEQVLAVMSGG